MRSMLPVAEVVGEHVLHRLARLVDAECIREGGSEQRRIAHRGEVDEDARIAELRTELLGGCDRASRVFPAPPGPVSVTETHVVAPQECA